MPQQHIHAILRPRRRRGVGVVPRKKRATSKGEDRLPTTLFQRDHNLVVEGVNSRTSQMESLEPLVCQPSKYHQMLTRSWCGVESEHEI